MSIKTHTFATGKYSSGKIRNSETLPVSAADMLAAIDAVARAM